ncbi:MAG: hypothetical protein HXL38_001995 [Candidatus Saccharimonas sp.]|nr:MAG: hypothetical protein HXL38_001995 [Candidatus Saccharimonas sp.]
MKKIINKIFVFSAIFIASIFILTSNKAFAQDFLPEAAKISNTTDTFKKFFEKGKSFSKDKWSNFQTVRDNYFEESIEAKGLTFVDKNGNQVEKAYFSISSKLRINPIIKIVDEDGNDEVEVSSWQARGEKSQFLFIDTVGFTRAKTNFTSGDNLLLPKDNYYVLALRIKSNGEKNSQEIWPVPVSKNEFKRLKALKKSAIGEEVKPIDGYNY